MKNTLPTGLLLALALAAGCQHHSPRAAAHAYAPAVAQSPPSPPRPRTFSSFDTAPDTNAPIAPHTIRFQDADLTMVLDVYRELSGRTLIRSPQVPMTSKITVENTVPLTRAEALQMFDNVLAANSITMVYLGTQYVKVVPAAGASAEAGPVIEGPWRQLPDSSSFVMYITRLKNLAPEDAVSVIMPYAKLPNSIIGVKGSEVLVLRDYSSNVRRMMDVLERVDKAQGNKSR